jgi:hypothetical protein
VKFNWQFASPKTSKVYVGLCIHTNFKAYGGQTIIFFEFIVSQSLLLLSPPNVNKLQFSCRRRRLKDKKTRKFKPKVDGMGTSLSFLFKI